MWFELNFVWLLTPAESYIGYKNTQSGTINFKKEINEELDMVFMDAMEKNHEQANRVQNKVWKGLL